MELAKALADVGPGKYFTKSGFKRENIDVKSGGKKGQEVNNLQSMSFIQKHTPYLVSSTKEHVKTDRPYPLSSTSKEQVQTVNQ